MKTYSMDHDGAMVERRSRKDRRVNPKITTEPEERKGERRERRRSSSRSMFEGFNISLISGSKTSGRENPTIDLNSMP